MIARTGKRDWVAELVAIGYRPTLTSDDLVELNRAIYN